jgi:hypothetical protein
MKEIALKAELDSKLSHQEYLQDKDKLVLEGAIQKENEVEVPGKI